MIPPLLLDIKSDELVLDMCAGNFIINNKNFNIRIRLFLSINNLIIAPGSKTS
jgi:hypothetical protein